MGIAERRERERESLRVQILEAARDILSEQGLDGLSMRAIADRIEYSPATIYLHFQSKDELIKAVVLEGFALMDGYMRAAVAEAGPSATPAQQYRASGKAYVRFALENTAYFRVMFELPGVAQMDCPEPCEDDIAITDERSFDRVVSQLERATRSGELHVPDALHGALVGWGLVHGLVSLYLSGHLSEVIDSSDKFMVLVDFALDSLRLGWLPRPQPVGPEVQHA